MSESRDSTRLHMAPVTVKSDQRSESAESIYKSETRPSGIPLAIPLRNQSKTPPVRSGTGTGTGTGSSRPSQPRPKSVPPPPQAVHQAVHHHFISPAEWARLAHGLGAIRDASGETHNVVHPTCWYWPPKGMPEGLYRDVVVERSQYFIFYHVLSTLRWFLMILQIVLGAILTALGSLTTGGTQHAIPITILAAVNTVSAGLLALMHNSGLPDRYRLNKVEFAKVEDYIKELLDTGIVENDQTVDSVLIDCFARFQTAKATVLVNMPDSYTMSTTPPREKSMILCPDPPAHFTTGHP